MLLALAKYTATLYPEIITYTETRQQAVDGAAIFVEFYSIGNAARLINSSEYTFGIQITYVPENRISSYELNSALFAIESSLRVLESDIGTFYVYNKSSDITDDLAHVTGTVSVRVYEPDTADIINKANQDLI